MSRTSIVKIVLLLVAASPCACGAEADDSSEVSESRERLSGGEYLFTCGGYDAYRGQNGIGFFVTVQGAGPASGFTIPLRVRYLPDSPADCNNYQVPVTGYPATNQTIGVGNLVWGCQDRQNTITGSAATDFICGGPFDDTINGGQSADFINGMGGIDTIHGGKDRDYIRGGKGNDKLFGDTDIDCLMGDLGLDELSGGSEADICVPGGLGADGASVNADCEGQTYSAAYCDDLVTRGNWNRGYTQ